MFASRINAWITQPRRGTSRRYQTLRDTTPTLVRSGIAVALRYRFWRTSSERAPFLAFGVYLDDDAAKAMNSKFIIVILVGAWTAISFMILRAVL